MVLKHVESKSQRLSSSRMRSNIAHFLVVALTGATGWAMFRAFHSTLDWMNLVQDDFFYYLKVAENIAAGRGSTFNGIVATNGYHPLWLCIISCAIWIGGPSIVPVLLGCTIFVGTMLTFVLSRLLLARSGVENLTATALSVYASVYAMHIYCYGMEVTLAVPAMLGLMLILQKISCLAAQGLCTWRSGLMVGTMMSIMVLSRLDTIVFAALIALFAVAQPELRRQIRPRFVLGILAGLAPLVAYIISNQVLFGVWMPISGLAKQLKLDHGFTAAAWAYFRGMRMGSLVNLCIVLTALMSLPAVVGRLKPIERSLVSASLLFPFVYTATLSWLSDWQLWGWYRYTLQAALIAAFMLLLRIGLVQSVFDRRSPLVLLVLLALVSLRAIRVDPQQPEIVRAARQLTDFSVTHPGIYAMGDRSGAVGYLLKSPVIQTEGLMMDKKFLSAIADQVPLRKLLSIYGVRYYVGSELQPYVGCFDAREPAQAGKHAPHMHAIFCENPIAEWTNDGVRTLVFDLGSEEPAHYNGDLPGPK